MPYRIDPQESPIKPCGKPRGGTKFSYRTVKEMRELYPDGNFTVIGEIGGIARFPDSGDRLISETGSAIPILPRGSLKRPFEWVCGYIAVGNHTYLAVIGSLIPTFLRRQRKMGEWPEEKPGKSILKEDKRE